MSIPTAIAIARPAFVSLQHGQAGRHRISAGLPHLSVDLAHDHRGLALPKERNDLWSATAMA
jgi:hypothetical protein